MGPLTQSVNMGRVRTKTIKKASRMIIEKYHTRLTMDFHTNKRICEDIAIIPSKRLRNQVAGFITHLMKRIKHAPVRGISIKLQEEERERRDNYAPEISYIDQHDLIEVDPDTKEMLKMLDMASIPGLQMVQPSAVQQNNFQNRDGNRDGGRPPRDGPKKLNILIHEIK